MPNITEHNVATGETVVREMNAEELALNADYDQNIAPVWRLEQLRNERNRRLAETDYFGMPDVVMTDEMAAYRQALRDLPANTADPANVVWPTKPN